MAWKLSPRVFLQKQDNHNRALRLDRVGWAALFSDLSRCQIVTALWKVYGKVRLEVQDMYTQTHTHTFPSPSHNTIESQIKLTTHNPHIVSCIHTTIAYSHTYTHLSYTDI